MKNDCFYCENGEKLHSSMIPICEFEYSVAAKPSVRKNGNHLSG